MHETLTTAPSDEGKEGKNTGKCTTTQISVQMVHERQEEEKNIIIEFQRKVLQEANCTAEMLAYLDEIDDDVFREYYCICALDGMTVEEIRRIDSIAVQDWRGKIKHIKEERLFRRVLFRSRTAEFSGKHIRT